MGAHGLWGLLASSFLAATILPLSSELVFVGLLSTGEFSPWSLFAVATLGNVGGAVVNFVLGKYALHFVDRPWFPVDATTLEKAHDRFALYGSPSLLLAWVPIIGDPLTVVAGVIQVRFPLFLLMVTMGKGGRYAFLIWVIGASTAG